MCSWGGSTGDTLDVAARIAFNVPARVNLADGAGCTVIAHVAGREHELRVDMADTRSLRELLEASGEARVDMLIADAHADGRLAVNMRARGARPPHAFWERDPFVTAGLDVVSRGADALALLDKAPRALVERVRLAGGATFTRFNGVAFGDDDGDTLLVNVRL